MRDAGEAPAGSTGLRRHVPTGLLLVALGAFLLPWVNLSCGEQPQGRTRTELFSVTQSGLQAGYGGTSFHAGSMSEPEARPAGSGNRSPDAAPLLLVYGALTAHWARRGAFRARAEVATRGHGCLLRRCPRSPPGPTAAWPPHRPGFREELGAAGRALPSVRRAPLHSVVLARPRRHGRGVAGRVRCKLFGDRPSVPSAVPVAEHTQLPQDSPGSSGTARPRPSRPNGGIPCATGRGCSSGSGNC